MDFTTLATDSTIAKTVAALKNNGIEALVVDNGASAKEAVLKIIPEGEQVMNMTSVTLDSIGVAQEITESGRFKSVRQTLTTMDRETQGPQMNCLGAAPIWVVGSVHAVTESGQVVVASNTGSQLPAYVYGAQHVIWVVGTQKIVPDLDTALKRIYDYILPLESDRMSKKVGKEIQSKVSKLLIVNREIKPDRITLIFVKEKLGF